MFLSYIIPVYNAAPFVANTIISLKDQTHKDFEIIAIDDGSDDDIQPLKEHFNDIRWITLDKRYGAAFCRNLGNIEALGDVIAVCDAGDFYLKNRGKNIAHFFEETENDLFYSDVQLNSPAGRPLGIQQAEAWDGNSKPPISHPTVAYKRPVPQYHEESLDTDLYEFFLFDCLKKV